MPNVLSSRERDRLMGMLPAGDVDYAGWTNIVGKLFELTSNPNQVDLYPRDGRPDVSTDLIHPQLNPNPGLRIGLTTESGRVRMERLGDGPKALTAALASVPPAETDPGFALSLANPDGRVEFPAITLLTGSELTLEAWVFPTALTATVNQTVLQQGQGLLPDWFLGFRNSGTAIGFGLQAGPTYEGLTAPINPTQLANRWVHIAATYDGETAEADPLAQLTWQTSEWAFGEPDYIIEIPQQEVPATGILDYYNALVEIDIEEDR